MIFLFSANKDVRGGIYVQYFISGGFAYAP